MTKSVQPQNEPRVDTEPLRSTASTGTAAVPAQPVHTSLQVEVAVDAVAGNMLRNTQRLLRLICKYGSGDYQARYMQDSFPVIVRAVFAYLHLSSHTSDDREEPSSLDDDLITSVKYEVYDRWNTAYLQVTGHIFPKTHLTPRNGLDVLVTRHMYENFVKSVEPQVRGYAEAIMDCNIDENNGSVKTLPGRVIFGQSLRHVELADELERKMRKAVVFRHTGIAREGNYRRQPDDLGGRIKRFLSHGVCFSCHRENCTNLVSITIFLDTRVTRRRLQ